MINRNMSKKPKKDMLEAFAKWLAMCLLLGSLLGGIPATHAQTSGATQCGGSATGETCNGGEQVASQGNTSGTNTGSGNPINVITGNKYQREVDLPPLPGVLGLEIVRHYNSNFSGHTIPTGILGRGWRLSYETELYVVGRTVQVVQADGSRVIFARDLVNPSQCATSNPANGKIVISRTARGDEYTWTWPNGKTLSFDHMGKLVQIKVPTGEFVSLQHDPKGMLIKVTDPQGRSLHLNYLDNRTASKGDRFRGVQSIDSPVGRFTYEYGSELPEGATIDKIHLLANLVKVSFPTHYDSSQKLHAYTERGVTSSSISRIYHYEDPAHPTFLTGISVTGAGSDGKLMNQRISTFAYDINGRGILSTHADNVDKVSLDYSEPGQTTITNSLDQKTVYRHAIIGGEFRLLEVRGAGCSLCGEPNVRYGYDKLGRLIETTRLDQAGRPLTAIKADLDHYGRPLKISKVEYSHGKPGQAQLVMRYEYQGLNPQPSMIARPSIIPGREYSTHITYNSNGQVKSVVEAGWRPAIDGKPAQPISRAVGYHYQIIAGKSVLTEIDGPLANGPKYKPEDSDITRLHWDPNGNFIVSMTTPGGFTSSISYDDAGRINQVTNAEGMQTTFTHDFNNHLASITRNGSGWTKPVIQNYLYDALGNLTEQGTGSKVENTYRGQARIGFDAANRPIWKTIDLGILNTNRYDTEGHLLESRRLSASMAQIRRYGYDDYGRLSTLSNNTGSFIKIGYGETGLPDMITDGLGRTKPSDHTHGADGGQEKGSDRNKRQNMRQLIDDFGRNIATISPDSGVMIRSFDEANHLTDSTDAAGNHAHYKYDTAGRIIEQAITDRHGKTSTVTQWCYDGMRLVAVIHPTQDETYRYDARGLLVTKTARIKRSAGSDIASVTSYAYDEDGILQQVSLPDGSYVEYERNGQGQIVALKRSRIQTAWLRWLLPAQTLVTDLQRDLVGLKHYKTGNGLDVNHQRSREGALARIVYRYSGDKPSALPLTSSALDWLVNAANAGETENRPSTRSSPGVLGLPSDPKALLDLRYLWDTQGNLLHLRQQAGTTTMASFAYDRNDHLIVSVLSENNVTQASRYFYDRQGRRLLSQQDITDQADLKTNTEKLLYQPGTHRWLGDRKVISDYDANGQPEHMGVRDYRWDALGRLMEVRDGGKTLARYTYNHRGERIAKDSSNLTYYLYQDKKLAAELDAKGRLVRQYVYLADTPIAVIDSKEGETLESDERGTWSRIEHDLATILRAWFADDEKMVWLHTNHLGAVEAATGQDGKLLWRASYRPSGRASIVSHGFMLNLRLPGQYEDAETGLHYNGHRYYAPQSGAYLTPDPLGTPDGPNPYAYVRSNPLRYIDPSGLVLFAFDGTGNSDPPQLGDSISNVRKFFLAYDQQANGTAYYITGIGTTNDNMPYQGSMIDGDGFDQRVALGFTDLDQFMSTDTGTGAIDIDVVGFSRGAAEARVWINQLVARLAKQDNGTYTYTANGKTRCVNLRFEGLWDTVPHLGYLNGNESQYDFGIPDAVKFAAQANALNEYRGGPANFNFRSILSGPTASSTGTRIEKGFLGSHSDIGGGFGTGDLSNVALMWMIDLANQQGIKFKEDDIRTNKWNVVSNPVLHDKSSNLINGAPDGGPTSTSEDRVVIYTDGETVKQRQATPGIMTYADTVPFITYKADPLTSDYISGTVDAKAYLQWLNAHGYNLNDVTAQ